MFVDARTLSHHPTIEADICIVGAGAAGITLAQDLRGGPHQVAVFESGDLTYNAETQSLYAGEVVGHTYVPLDRTRLRYFGGSTNHWQGSCRPFDALDLQDWPFGLEVLQPYYLRAQPICQLGPYDYDPGHWSGADAQPITPAPGSVLKSGVFQYSPPTRFGSVYRDDLASAGNVTVYLNANLVNIDTNETAGEVTGLDIACLGGPRFRARAKHYVLAAGGIENPRLLLSSDRVQKSGLGNSFDLVGRYFMDHAFVPAAATLIGDAARPQWGFYDHRLVRGHIIEGYLCATDAVRRAEALPPFAIGFRAIKDQSDLGNFTIPGPLRRLLSDSRANQLSFYAGAAINRLEAPAAWLYRKMWRAAPGVYKSFYICGPKPDPESRVTLSDSRDELGMRRSRLDWRLPADFAAVMRRAHELLAQELGRAGLGRVRLDSNATGGYDPLQDLGSGQHQMGTTRMSVDPRRGVVDADCRVHGVANLFIAGSSVYPSYACDDPTLTIVALSLRLSDHLKSLLASASS